MFVQRDQTNLIVFHCSATKPGQNIGAAEIDGWHKDRGWRGIGYHLVIRRSGRIEPGRPLNDVGAHVKSHNYESVGVCMIGGIDDAGKPANNFTEAQWKSADIVAHYLRAMYPTAKILGHRDLSPDLDGDGIIEQHEWLKDCPCFDALHRWEHT